MTNPTNRRYRYGASFVDEESGVRFEGHHPFERPDLWRIYLNEAEGIYRSRGFEETLRRRELEEGIGVALFFLGFAPDGNAVAGVRFHGPLESSHQAAIMEEMAGSSEIGLIGETIDREVRLGAIEAKGAWSKGEAVAGHRLVAAISRAITHATTWLGAEFAIAAISDRLLPTADVTGAKMIGTEAVPFPDERYRTHAMEWRRSRTPELCTPQYQIALRREAEQLARGPEDSLYESPERPSVRTASWRPLVLDANRRSDREMLRVLREDPSVQIIDRYDEQLEELSQVKPAPGASLLNEGHRWIYFPWRRTIVRLLAPRGFNTLRLDRNRNKLTRAEQDRLGTLRIGVIGASAGHAIAHVLAMEGIAGEIRVADFDTVAVSNLNRIPGSVLDIGINKAVVAARRIGEIDPYVKVIAETAGITPTNLERFLDGLDLVIEECDSLDMKFVVREAARSQRIPVIMETSDRGVLDVERYDLDPEMPLFHGLLGDLDAATVAGLSTQEKGPYVLRLLGPRDVSAKGAASLLELGQTITAWPQLGSEVTLGAVTTAAAVRRWGLGRPLASGRVRFDVEEILEGLAPVIRESDVDADFASTPPTDPLPETDDPVEVIVDAARRAPSGGNIQPWRFEADDDEVRFFLVPERTSTMDVRHRGGYVALGASLMNARVAAAAQGRLGPVRLFPEGEQSRHVATLKLGTATDLQLSPLYAAVPQRAANRRMGRQGTIEQSLIDALSREVEKEGALLRTVHDSERMERGADLLAESDRLRFLIPRVHDEMFGELRWPGQHTLDHGLDVRSLEVNAHSAPLIEVLSRSDVVNEVAQWRGGSALGLGTKAAIQSSVALVAITVPRADPTWYVRGGAALERFWLTTEMHGLAVQPVSPVFLYATDEDDLATLGGERYLDEMYALSAQFRDFWEMNAGEAFVMVLRVFYADAPSVHSIRYRLREVLSRSDDVTPIRDMAVGL